MTDDDLEAALGRDESMWRELAGARIFITGGTGFVGKWLLESLAAADARFRLGATAVVLSRDPQAFAASHPALHGLPGVSWVRGDVRDFAFPAGDFTHAIHAATDVARQAAPEETHDSIVRGTERVLDFCRERHVRELLLLSSGAVYGPQPASVERIEEDDAGAPATRLPTAYGQGKRAAESLACARAGRDGIAVRIARVFALVGPHLPLEGRFAVGDFIADRAAGREILVRGDGTAVRSYLYAADLARWLWTLLVRGTPGAAYNVGSEQAIDVAALARRVAALDNGGHGIRISQSPRPGAAVERYVPRTHKAREELGLEATVALDDALARTLAWARSVGRGVR